MLTQERVRELFDYRDGRLYWKIGCANRVGKRAGSYDAHGYRVVTIGKGYYKEHRIIWLLTHGYTPELGVDHINRVRDDNRIENLREVSQQCNLRNSGVASCNTSGVKGVSWDKVNKKWRAVIKLNTIYYSLGRFNCFDEAVAHRLAAEQCLGWEFCDQLTSAAAHMRNLLVI